MSKTLRISLTEKQLLKAYIDNPDLLTEEDIFITEIGKEFQYILLSLKDDGLSFIPEHIIKRSEEFVTPEALSSILDTEYQADKVSVYERELDVDNKLQVLESDILKQITVELTKKGAKDLDILESIYEKFGDTLESIKQEDDSKPFTFRKALDKHAPVLLKRSTHVSQTTGCYMLDRLMPNPVAGLCILGGFSGSMKTTYTMYLEKQRLIKRLPTGAINTELAFNGYMDNFIPSMIKENYHDILGLDIDNTDFNSIVEKFEVLQDRYGRHDKFLLYPKPTASIQEVKLFIKYCRKKMGLHKDTLFYLFVDLLSMLEDFGESGNSTKADAIENGVNKLNNMALEENTLIFGTVQFKRPEFATGRKIEKIEDLEKLRASLSSIKSSGAWQERARFVLLLNNPYHMARSFPCNPIIRELIDPILEVTMAKDTYMGMNGNSVKYYFHSNYKQLVPYEEEYEENEGAEQSEDED